jgi:hypothetical protein
LSVANDRHFLVELTAWFWRYGLVANARQAPLEARLFKWMMLDENSWAYSFLQNYIDVTGSQQYWDFFAPQSPRLHQYLSVCDSIIAYPDQGKIACKTRKTQ